MILKFGIPNGRMTVDLKEFAAGAGIRKIRKMFRMYAQSGPELREVRQIREYLAEAAQEQSQKAAKAKADYEAVNLRVKVLERQVKKARDMEQFILPEKIDEGRKYRGELKTRLGMTRQERKNLKLEEAAARRKSSAYLGALIAAEEMLGKEEIW